ncbi:uncharacterized protein STUB1-DT isoform X2 [Erinaceus europaeus]|uniref:Uncharacterized protein STUB1-DT isoform X2 n=1 Tax=Erinaceus europaeus TaxID=9365 RepID=A0ABM3VWI0_ERIEU|nr:uncharacterized protein STUB1-DT isoform X2 [Erinaceus europaeus]
MAPRGPSRSRLSARPPPAARAPSAWAAGTSGRRRARACATGRGAGPKGQAAGSRAPSAANMAAPCDLWECEDPGHWAAVLARHGEVLRARSGPQRRLAALDRWYQEELPAAIDSRAERHVTRPELEQLLSWKLALIHANPPELVVQRSASAFRLLPDASAAVTQLCALRGVGPATASAVLAAGAPEVVAFMSDEAVAAVSGLPAMRYTLKHYLLYLDQVQKRATALNRGGASGMWTPQRVETALWTWIVGQKLCPSLLPNLHRHQDTPANDDSGLRSTKLQPTELGCGLGPVQLSANAGHTSLDNALTKQEPAASAAE